MIKSIYSIYDTKICAYMPPFFAITDGEAVRYVRGAVEDPNTMLNKYPEDYTLFCLGSFDDESGEVVSLATPRSVLGIIVLKSLNEKHKPSVAGLDPTLSSVLSASNPDVSKGFKEH